MQSFFRKKKRRFVAKWKCYGIINAKSRRKTEGFLWEWLSSARCLWTSRVSHVGVYPHRAERWARGADSRRRRANVAEDIANCELRPTFVSLVDDSGNRRGCCAQAEKPQGEHRLYPQKPETAWEHGWRSSTTTGCGRVHLPAAESAAHCPHRWSRTATRFSKTRTASSLRSTWTRKSSTHLPAGAEVWKACLRRGGEHEHCVGKTGFSSVHGLLCLQSAGGGNPVFR